MTDAFEEELKETIASCARRARRNYCYAHAIFAVAVLSSFTAAVLASGDLGKAWLGDQPHKAVIAVLAALPGFMLLINNTLRFEERTRWFWRKVRLAERYYRQVRDQNNPVACAASKRYSEEEEALEIEWPAFGSSPGQPSKPGR